jgi:hypothetical protein
MAGTIEILLPHGERPPHEPLALATRPPDLKGATIGFVDNGFAAVAAIQREIMRRLAADGTTAIVVHKRYWRPLETAVLDDLAARAHAVVGGLCATPPSTSWGVLDSVELEARGTPTVTIATARYEALLSETAAAEGMPDLPHVVLPDDLDALPAEDVREVARAAVDDIVAALTDDAVRAGARA